MNITIVGGGNIGMLFAVHCGANGHNVTIYTSKYNQYKKNLSVININNEELLTGEINCATYNPQIAFSEADLIFVTVPPFCAQDTYKNIADYAQKTPPVGFIPGSGGVEFVFSKYKGDIFGLQRVPAISRIQTQGKTVCATGYKDELFLSSMNNNAKKYCELMSKLFKIPCNDIRCYLNITLTPSNPILHTARLYSMFKNYRAETRYDKIPLFYEDWTDEASKVMLDCDAELQEICRTYKELDLRWIKSLKNHYESQTPKELTDKIRSIKAFKNILTPMIKADGGYIPDFNSRYFTSDFPYGLFIIKQIGEIAECKIQNINMVWNWYHNMFSETSGFNIKKYGINSMEDVLKFYSKAKL